MREPGGNLSADIDNRIVASQERNENGDGQDTKSGDENYVNEGRLNGSQG